MKNIFLFILAFNFLISCKASEKKDTTAIKTIANQKETISFPSKDGLPITADVYWSNNKNNPFILLFHQARFSRGEYLEIAPKLNALGFNCMAIDQRSGDKVNGVINQTHLAAIAKGLSTKYPDALPDLEASVDYVIKNYHPKKLIIWGSSYSSALNFIVGSHYKNQLSGLLSFSPGEYFTYDGKSIKDFAKDIEIPVFITSARDEAPYWKPIFDVIPSKNKVSFIPKSKGKHGSKALWETHLNSAVYWKAVKDFLKNI